MAKPKPQQFRFRRHDKIGTEGAEEDGEFLSSCFVDNGDLSLLADTTSAPRIVVGRTGTGKSALLMMLRNQQEHVAWLEPEKLALQYVANSTIVRRLTDLGINLDIFYRLLWRHVFAVELIRLKYNVRSESDQHRFFQKIGEIFSRDKRKEIALDYLREWGEHFWEDTEYRIHEVTSKLEEEIKASLGGSLEVLNVKAEVSSKQTDEERKEIVHRLQDVVNSVQIRKLGELIEALSEDVFVDQQESYYVIVDQLDENWVDDPLRYSLIRALIETVKDLKKITAAKVVVAIRKDLLDRVFRHTRDSGFQEEKYQALLLRLHWNERQLMQVIDRRVNQLVQRQYTQKEVSWQDILPRSIGKMNTATYIVRRTLFRPRDVIQFLNCCITQAEDRPTITQTMLRAAEGDYSSLRFRSLQDEWIVDYPNLLKFADILKMMPKTFPSSDLESDRLDSILLSEASEIESDSGPLSTWARLVYDNEITFEEFRRRIIKVFYQVGLIGLKIDVGAPVSWSFLESNVLKEAEISEDVRIEICPMLYRVLGTQLPK